MQAEQANRACPCASRRERGPLNPIRDRPPPIPRSISSTRRSRAAPTASPRDPPRPFGASRIPRAWLGCAREPRPRAAPARPPLSPGAPHRRRDPRRAGLPRLPRVEPREAPRLLHRPSPLHDPRRPRRRAGRADRVLARALPVHGVRPRPARFDDGHRIGGGVARAAPPRDRRGAGARDPARDAPAGPGVLDPVRVPRLLLPQVRVGRGRDHAPDRVLAGEPAGVRGGAPHAPPDAARPSRRAGAVRARRAAGTPGARAPSRVVGAAVVDLSRRLGRVRRPPPRPDRRLPVLRGRHDERSVQAGAHAERVRRRHAGRASRARRPSRLARRSSGEIHFAAPGDAAGRCCSRRHRTCDRDPRSGSWPTPATSAPGSCCALST